MNGWNDFFYYFIIGSTLLLSTLGLCFIAIMPGIDRWKKRFFRSFFIVLMLNDCTVMTDIVLRAYSAPVAAIRFVQVLECLLLALPLPMLTVFLLHCCGENMRQSRLLHAVLGLWAAYLRRRRECGVKIVYLAHPPSSYPDVLEGLHTQDVLVGQEGGQGSGWDGTLSRGRSAAFFGQSGEAGFELLAQFPS